MPDEDGALFAALEIEAEVMVRATDAIEIVSGDVVIRVGADTSAIRIAEIAAALRGAR